MFDEWNEGNPTIIYIYIYIYIYFLVYSADIGKHQWSDTLLSWSGLCFVQNSPEEFVVKRIEGIKYVYQGLQFHINKNKFKKKKQKSRFLSHFILCSTSLLIKLLSLRTRIRKRKKKKKKAAIWRIFVSVWS